jgi:hypothetical protein
MELVDYVVISFLVSSGALVMFSIMVGVIYITTSSV